MKFNSLYLNKLISEYFPGKENFDKEDLDSFETIRIEELIDFSELSNLCNLQTLQIFNCNLNLLSLKEISGLKSLKEIYFINCEVVGLSLLEELSLDTLFMDNCVITDIEGIDALSIKHLFLDNIKEVDLDQISIIRVLESLSLINTTVLNEDKMIYMDKIINLNLYGTSIKSIDTLIGNETLKTLVIDEDIYNNNKEVVRVLKDRGISVVNEMNQDVESAYEDR